MKNNIVKKLFFTVFCIILTVSLLARQNHNSWQNFNLNSANYATWPYSYVFDLPTVSITNPDNWGRSYYKNPQIEKIPIIINDMIKLNVFKPRYVSQIAAASIFLTKIMASNSNKINAWIHEVKPQTEYQRYCIYKMIWNMNTNESKNYITQLSISENRNISTVAKKVMQNAPIDILKIPITGVVIDQLWGAYFATGNVVYLKRMFEFINEDTNLLIAGYEIVNRNVNCLYTVSVNENKACSKTMYADLTKNFKKHYPKNYKQMAKVATDIASAIWSITSNEKQDKIIRAKIVDLIKEHPELDYWNKIKIVFNN